MKTYKFKHESVLNYRVQIEDTLKRDFIGLQRSLSAEEARLIEFGDLHTRKSDEMVAKEVQSPNDINIYRGYLKFLKLQMGKSRETITSIQEEIDKKREELLSASKDKKILEVIKDKGRTNHIKAEVKSEQSVNDEFNINRFSK